MSKLVKKIGKVFKKVGKIVMKVAPYALAAAAVVMTAGAALSLTPTFAAGVSSVIGGLGLSAGATTAITGAVVGAGFGAAAGGILGGSKGLKQGFIMGGLTGGIMPASMPGMGNVLAKQALTSGVGTLSPTLAADKITAGLASSATTGAGAAGAGTSIAPLSFLSAPSVAPGPIGTAAASAPGAGIGGATAATQAATTAAGTTSTTGGLFGGNSLLASQLLGGVTSMFEPNETREAIRAKAEEERGMGFFAYGGGDPDGKGKQFGILPGVYSGRQNPLGIQPWAPPPASIAPAPVTKRWAWDPTTSSVKEVPV